MPPVVGESMDEVLARLEAALQEHAPESLQHLQPGLSAEKIAELERAGGFQLSDDLRALYRWRNGVPADDDTDIIPRYRFRSLEDLVEIRRADAQDREASTPAVRAIHNAIVGYTGPWIPIFQEAAGDGYFYDPTRRPEQGAVFFNFLEMGTFHFYPSLKNLLVAICECYETGAYAVDAAGQLNKDYEKSVRIHGKYGVDRTL